MDLFDQAAEKIISEQENIIGPVAVEQAGKVQGLKLNWGQHQVGLEGNKTAILEELVQQYKELFGQASVEVCKQAVADIISKISPPEIPESLR